MYKVIGTFSAISGLKARCGINESTLANNTCKILCEKGFDVEVKGDIMYEVHFATKSLKEADKVSKKLIKLGAYKIMLEVI